MSVILMSLRRGAPYDDRIEDSGRTLIYEGHDIPRTKGGPDPKTIDQPRYSRPGRLTQNGLFFEAAVRAARAEQLPELVKVYEKIRDGVWAFDGVFELRDAWQDKRDQRNVFRFRLVLSETEPTANDRLENELPHNRLIPSSVKLEVWKRDKGNCVLCGSSKNLHFDHIIPFSQGGSSLVAKNIQLLCAKHNLQKHDKII
ncbi:MAG TPA: HNH endonuclease signature motif containing protein [Candidatus Acidoferrales bacterium]|nr:HNH endonuclease signature motif containing protein [Candidatus Acidoferrales bacterium]